MYFKYKSNTYIFIVNLKLGKKEVKKYKEYDNVGRVNKSELTEFTI